MGRWQRPLILAATVAAVLVAVFVLRPQSPSGDRQSPPIDAAAVPQVGSVAPDFTATALDGSSVSLAQLRGKPVWLVFGASWCAACRAEAADIEAAATKAKADGVTVVAIYVDEDAAAVTAYTQRVGLSTINVPDPQSRVAGAYASRGVPAHYFLDANGVVRSSILGIVTESTAAGALAAAEHPAAKLSRGGQPKSWAVSAARAPSSDGPYQTSSRPSTSRTSWPAKHSGPSSALKA